MLDVHREDYAERKNHPPYHGRPSPLPCEEHSDGFIGRMGLEWLASRPRQPFFLWVSFTGPHNPWDAPGAYGAMYNPADMPPPLAWSEQFEGKPPSQRKRAEQSGLLDLDVREVQAMAAQYYGLISNIDDWCGRIPRRCGRGGAPSPPAGRSGDRPLRARARRASRCWLLITAPLQPALYARRWRRPWIPIAPCWSWPAPRRRRALSATT